MISTISSIQNDPCHIWDKKYIPVILSSWKRWILHLFRILGCRASYIFLSCAPCFSFYVSLLSLAIFYFPIMLSTVKFVVSISYLWSLTFWSAVSFEPRDSLNRWKLVFGALLQGICGCVLLTSFLPANSLFPHHMIALYWPFVLILVHMQLGA